MVAVLIMLVCLPQEKRIGYVITSALIAAAAYIVYGLVPIVFGVVSFFADWQHLPTWAAEMLGGIPVAALWIWSGIPKKSKASDAAQELNDNPVAVD